MKKEEYPCYYLSVDKDSIDNQRYFFLIVLAEYLLSFLIVFETTFFKNIEVLLILFLLSVSVFLLRIFTKFDRKWFKSRAYSESIKSMTWKWIMSSRNEKEFKVQIDAFILNNHIVLNPYTSHDDLITVEMRKIKELQDSEKYLYYRENRITDQEKWYKRKIIYNKKRFVMISSLTVIAYTLAIVYLIHNLKNGVKSDKYYDLIVIFCTLLLSWANIKKYNELIEAYTITLNDIVVLKNNILSFEEVDDFNNYIDDCENAFSREHTQWYARKKLN